MARLKLQLRVTKALASAGASEEILALVNLCFEQCLTPQDTGRPRQYANRNEQQRDAAANNPTISLNGDETNAGIRQQTRHEHAGIG